MLINKSKCRKAILCMAREQRAHVFTRVSEGVMADLNRCVASRIEHIVRSHPSAGKTINV